MSVGGATPDPPSQSAGGHRGAAWAAMCLSSPSGIPHLRSRKLGDLPEAPTKSSA